MSLEERVNQAWKATVDMGLEAYSRSLETIDVAWNLVTFCKGLKQSELNEIAAILPSVMRNGVN